MHLYLLETSVKLDLNELPLVHLLIIVISFLAFVAFLLVCGFTLKFGDKEINIGGVQRLLAKRDKDTLLKESLKKFSDDVDHEVTANLYDLVEQIEDDLGPRLMQGEHCYFSFEKFSSIVKNELYKRIRRNNLWEKLSDAGKERYIATILRDIEKRYDLLQAKTKQVKCGDTYAEFSNVKNDIRDVLINFFDGTIDILVDGMKKKCEKYEKSKEEFETTAARKICCDDCIAKNQERIKRLTGTIAG